MDTKIIDYLINAVYKYYCVGIPQYSSIYNGTGMIREIVSQKINDLIAKKETAWTKLVGEIQNGFPEKTVFDMAYIQFPSFLLSLPVEATNDKCQTRIFIAISLLAHAFTIFFEDNYPMNEYKSINETGTATRIIYSESSNDSTSKETLLARLKELALTYFPAYNFIEHSVLFQHEVKAIAPWPNSFDGQSDRAVTLYQLLFDGLTPFDGIRILK